MIKTPISYLRRWWLRISEPAEGALRFKFDAARLLREQT